MAKVKTDRQHLIDTLISQGLTKKQATAEADALDQAQDRVLVLGKDGKMRPAPPGPSIFD